MQSSLSQWRKRRLREGSDEGNNGHHKVVVLREGLVLEMGAWPPEELQVHMNNLTFQPRAGFSEAPAPPICCYKVQDSLLILPRHYTHLSGALIQEELSEGEPCALSFSGTLNELQQEAKARSCEALLRSPYACILTLPCGFGKTVVALSIAQEMGRKTLIVVHKENLLQQWCERIATFLPTARVGIIQQRREDTRDVDVCVAMLQTICLRELDAEQLRSFGLVVLDEAHHLAAPFFSRLWFKLSCKKILGLTATPKRKDGCTSILHLFMGPFSLQVAARSEEGVRVYSRRWRNGFQTAADLTNAQVQKLKGRLTADPVRNSYILELCQRAVAQGRTVICLSERLKHLSLLEEGWVALGTQVECARFVGGKSKENLAERRRAETLARVIFASYSMASEGLDIPRLDTLVLCTPVADVTQAVGRILRPCEDKKCPVVLDFQDDGCVAFARLAKARLACFQKHAFQLHLDEDPCFE